jgi:hypothetical protein
MQDDVKSGESTVPAHKSGHRAVVDCDECGGHGVIGYPEEQAYPRWVAGDPLPKCPSCARARGDV